VNESRQKTILATFQVDSLIRNISRLPAVGHICQQIICLTERHTQSQPGEYQLKHNDMLTIASLLSILFGTFHLADDINRGMSPEGFQTFLRW
jgi:hypothetical protein